MPYTAAKGKSSEQRTPSMRIVEEVARAKDVDPLELAPLFETIDGDALDDLFTNADTAVSVTVEYEGYTVTIRTNGTVTLTK